MTSAARPTWSAALASGGGLRDGSSSAPTLQTCAKDQPGHLKLKLRQIGQDSPEEIRSKDAENKKWSAELAPRLMSNYISGDSDVEIGESSSESDENEIKNDILAQDTDLENYSHSNDDEEDDELMRELEKIRREREAEKLAKEKKIAESDPHSVLSGNPLLTMSSDAAEISSFGIKRRWDDDVVFKNQAKGSDKKPEKVFINDTTRSDFHRRFMDKFIK